MSAEKKSVTLLCRKHLYQRLTRARAAGDTTDENLILLECGERGIIFLPVELALKARKGEQRRKISHQKANTHLLYQRKLKASQVDDLVELEKINTELIKRGITVRKKRMSDYGNDLDRRAARNDQGCDVIPRGIGRVLTSYEPPPIPVRHYDWTAFFEEGSVTGWGITEESAIADLWERVGEQE